MAANEFIVKLKADGSIKDQCDIEKVYREYNTLSNKLTTKDRGTFALNVLCILCRNLEKVPSWGEKADCKALLMLSIECVRGTRNLERADCVKTLACVFHLHKYVVRKNTPMPPELVLKLSYMPFENDTLLNEYSKTYWNIVADRLHYIEKLKPKLSIIKLLPKLSEHIIRTMLIYDNILFCSNILSYVVKKLSFLYNDTAAKDLNQIYGNIFENLTKSDLKSFKKLNEKDLLDLYVKFNDCLYYIAENASRLKFKDSSLTNAVRSCITLIGHQADKFHCFQTFYSNMFCSILTVNSDSLYMETVLNSFIISCETTERLGYKNAMQAIYPFLNQLLRLYVENFHENFTETLQEKCLELILFLMKKLKKSHQLWKCDNCKAKTGLHDSLRLSLLIKLFIKEQANADKVLPIFHDVVKEQYVILNDLKNVGCSNYINYYMKIQTDIHNLAIKLNRSQSYKYSIELFDVYLKNEFENLKDSTDTKNICRALYNKSICETDCKLYERALTDAFLSQIFAQNEGLSNDKYLSLVMDIKAKSLKDKEVDLDDKLQLMSVLEACESVVGSNYYGNLKPFLSNLKFSILLKHEFSKYVKLWPAIVPISGVWMSLNELTKHKDVAWLNYEYEEILLNTLYDIILETPTVVRTLHNEYFNQIITELLERFEELPANTTDVKVIHATLLFMKAEFDLAEASLKYNWKIKDPKSDPLLIPASRTIPQEHKACLKAVKAVEIWTLLVKELDTVKNKSNLSLALQMAQLFVYQLLYLYKTAHGLQMAYVCCQIAKYICDKEVFVTNAGTILYHMNGVSDVLNDIISLAARWCAELMENVPTIQSAIVFTCDAAIFYSKCGSIAKSAKLVQIAQARILAAYQKHPEINLDLAVGRLLEAQTLLCQDSGPSTLTAITNTQRHYISITSSGCGYIVRRAQGVRAKALVRSSSASACATCRSLRLWARARSLCACAAPAASAHDHALLHAYNTNTAHTDDAQIKIYNRLKHVLGLQSTNEIQSYGNTADSNIKKEQFTPKQDIETMLENLVFKRTETSPLSCTSIPAFKTPAFLKHDLNCDCYACESPYCIVLAGQMCGLDASMYFRAQEFEIAKNYIDGTLKCFSYIDAKLKSVFKRFLDCNFEKFLIDSFENSIGSEFGRVKVEILIEAAFYELSQKNDSVADDYVVRIHEIIQDIGDIDKYLRNDIMNLMAASARLRKVIKLPDIEALEIELDSLKLSPNIEPPSTPVNKVPPPKNVNILVKDEELPKLKRKAIKLQLDYGTSDDTEIKEDTSKKTEFKIPVPVTSKAVLENITPRPSRLKSKADKLIDKPSRLKPQILVTQPSIEEISTPKTKVENEFFTPSETPEQFFTPLTSVKTYAKKSLRHNIVKNLESEFSTPIDKENSTLKRASRSDVASKSRSNINTVKTLKRATSPGKLERDDTTKTRTRRLRQPVNYSLDKDGK